MGKHEMKDSPPPEGEVIVDLEDGKVYDTSENPAREIDIP
jgi:hypothetical protein